MRRVTATASKAIPPRVVKRAVTASKKVLTPKVITRAKVMTRAVSLSIIVARVFENHVISRIRKSFSTVRQGMDTTAKVYENLAIKWATSASSSKLLALRQHTSGNQTTLFFDGSLAFKSIWESIKSAKTRIWIETYQLSPDPVGLFTIRLLAEAAARGVYVVLLYDGVGSYTLRNHHLQPLLQAKATVLEYHRPFSRFAIPWLDRNHRKLVLVDDDIAYTGGMNIGGDYAGEDIGGTGRFYDTHVCIRGPVVVHLTNGFIRSVKYASLIEWWRLKEWCKNKEKKQIVRFSNNVFVQVLDSDVLRNRRNIQKGIILAINNAKKRCDVMTPYFLPHDMLKAAILQARERGVQLRLFTQGKCNTPLVNHASQHIYGCFLRAGVQVYQMYQQELHAKAVVIDGIFTTIGTFNFDILSFENNLEVNLAILDPHTANLMKEQFDNGVSKCKLMTLEEWEKRPWWKQVGQYLAYVMCWLVFECNLVKKWRK